MRPLLLAFSALSLTAMTACNKSEDLPAPVAEVPEPAPEPAIDIEALGIPMDADSIADGEAIALSHCSNCHGVGDADSLRADAPPLRYLLAQFPPEALAENFRYGIHVGHEDMPDFVFGDLGMDVLLSYIVSIQETPPEE